MKVSDLQIQNRIHPFDPQRIQPQRGKMDGAAQVDDGAKVDPFGEVLRKTIDENTHVRFSEHALQRLTQRSLAPNAQQLSRLDDGIRQLDAKGSRNSVVLVDDTAYIVSVKNKTVVTAVDNMAANSNIFTNIDSMAVV